MISIEATENRGFTRDFAHTRTVVKAAALACLIIIQTLLPSWTTAQAHEVSLNTVAHVYFSPAGGCTEALVSEINKAKSEILVQAYSFTSKKIASALADAQARGVDVQIILDKSQRSARGSLAVFERRAGVRVYIDRLHAIAHNKVMIIDGSTVVTGSFNFTRAAEMKNAENLLIVKSSGLAQLYRSNWNEHKSHSEAYYGR